MNLGGADLFSYIFAMHFAFPGLGYYTGESNTFTYVDSVPSTPRKSQSDLIKARFNL